MARRKVTPAELARLKALRRKYGLGEFKEKKKRRRASKEPAEKSKWRVSTYDSWLNPL